MNTGPTSCTAARLYATAAHGNSIAARQVVTEEKSRDESACGETELASHGTGAGNCDKELASDDTVAVSCGCVQTSGGATGGAGIHL